MLMCKHNFWLLKIWQSQNLNGKTDSTCSNFLFLTYWLISILIHAIIWIQEDERLRSQVNQHRTHHANEQISWAIIALYMGTRTAKQCRERWFLTYMLLNICNHTFSSTNFVLIINNLRWINHLNESSEYNSLCISCVCIVPIVPNPYLTLTNPKL